LQGVEGTLPEIALRYCLSQPAVSSVIPGMRKVRTVESSCSVSDLGALPDEVLAKMKKHAWVKDFHS
jgi:aryl-alcohol dehydrogenase-like predicted oxidoreductase